MIDYSVHTDNASLLRTDNPFLVGYWRMGDSLPPEPSLQPVGVNGSGWLTDDSLYRKHLTTKSITTSDFDIVTGLTPYGSNSGLKLQISSSPTNKRIFLPASDVALNRGQLVPSEFNKPSGFTITGWVSVPVATGHRDGHIINMVENPEAMGGGDVFSIAWDGNTASAGHVKFSMRTEAGSNNLIRADQFPTIINSGLFFAARYRNFAPLAPGGESGIMELFVGSHSSGLVLADSQIITSATSVGIAKPSDTEKPLSFGIKAHHDASFINTGAFLPDGAIIDDISFWYMGLSYNQMSHIKESGITVVDRDIQPIPPSNSGLLAYWRFDNNDSADVVGINSNPIYGDRFNLKLSTPGDITPVAGINVDGIPGSGVQINTNSTDFDRSLYLPRNSGFPDMFPAKDRGDFTLIGWHKFASANFKSWIAEWVHEDLIAGSRPNQIMAGQGTFLNNSLFGQGLSEFDASGEIHDVTITSDVLGATADIPKQNEWNLYAGVWDNTNGIMYVVKNARKIIGILEISPSGSNRDRFDVNTPEVKVSFKFLKLINDPQDVIFDEWAMFNRVLSLPEMSGYALSGVQVAAVPSAATTPLFDSPDPRLLGYYGFSVSGSFGNNSPRFEDESYYRHHLDEIVGDFTITNPLEDNFGAGESGSLQILSSGSYLNLAREKLGANFDFSQRELWTKGWSAGMWVNVPSGGTLNFNEHDLFFMGSWNTSGFNQRSWAIATSGGKLSARVSMDSNHYAFVSPSSLSLDVPIFIAMSAIKSEVENGTLIKLHTGISGVTSVSTVASGIVPSFDFDESSDSGLCIFAIPEYANLDGNGSNFAGCPSGTTIQSAFIFAEDIDISGITNIRNAAINKIALIPATVSSTDSNNVSHWKLDFIENTIRDYGKEQNHLTIQGSQNILASSGIHNSGLQIDDFTWLQTEIGKAPVRLDLGSGTSSFTILGWAAIFEDPVDTDKIILAKGGLDGSGYRFLSSNDILQFASDKHTGSGNNSPVQLGSGTDTVFNHLAFIYNRTLDQTTTVVNGRYAGSTFNILSGITTTTSGFALGGNSIAPGVVDPFGGGANTSGLFDDFMIFDRELTLAEISGLARDSYNYVESEGSSSTLVGAYLAGLATESISDLVGGFIHGLGSEFEIAGGYVSGVQGQLDHIGGFVHGKLISSGIAGAWTHGMDQVSGLLGAYMRGKDIGSGIIGSYILGGCEDSAEFDITFTFTILAAKDFDARVGVELTSSKDFDARIAVIQITQPPLCSIVSPTSGLVIDGVPYTLTLQASGIAQNDKKISHVRFTWSDFTPANSGTLISGLSNSGVFEASHTYWTPGFFTPKIEIIDEFGYRTSCCYQLMIAPTGMASGTFAALLPQLELLVNDSDGGTQHDVDFTTLASGAPIVMDELDFADGQTTLVNSTEMPSLGPYSGIVRQHTYTMPGNFCAVWATSGTEGIMTDTLRIGNDFEGF